VLSLKQQYRTSDFKFFHTLPTAQIWYRLAALKKHLIGIHFTCDEAVPVATGKWFEELYNNRFNRLVHCWQHCIKQEGDYVEK
jgi:hypothetical protein